MTQSLVRLAARLGAAASLLAVVPLCGHGQTVTGNIRGRVAEPSGTAVASATLTATNVETGVTRTTLTDADGRYRLLGLSPGKYRVRAQAIGHRPLEKTGYRVQLGDELVVDFELAAAAVEVAAIPVVADATPLVDPSKSGVSRTVSEAEVQNLPANGRNFTDFIALAPTYTATPKFGSGGSIGTIGGGRNSGAILNIDGVENTGSFFGGDPRGGDRLPMAFSIESVKEFQVLTNEYDVSKGGFTGGLVNAVTKSGTQFLRVLPEPEPDPGRLPRQSGAGLSLAPVRRGVIRPNRPGSRALFRNGGPAGSPRARDRHRFQRARHPGHDAQPARQHHPDSLCRRSWPARDSEH